MVTLPAHRLANKILKEFKLQDETWELSKDNERISELTQHLKELTKLFTKVIEKQWLASAARLKMRMDSVSIDIKCRTEAMASDADGIIAGLRNYPSQLDLTEDLKAVEKEFGGLHYDQDDDEIVVISEDIIFSNVNLGSFEIRIPISMGGSRVTIVACNPNYPAADEETTHPHVQSNTMCLGRGTDQFYDAMQQGRILDAFTILNSILETYNPDSAYVKIENWNRDSDDYEECNDCGDEISIEEATSCHKCSSSYCRDCVFECSGCQEYYCAYCISRSSKCSICKGKHLCGDCTYQCKTCKEIFCNECINDDDEDKELNCANCQKDLDEGLGIEVRPECVGQIMLSAG